MLKRALALVVAGAAVATGGVVLTSSAATGPALIRITSAQTKYMRIDVGRSGTSAGDDEFIRAQLFNRRITSKPIGRTEMVCTFTFGTSRQCRGVFFLAKGKIVVSGALTSRSIYEFAIVGGTGLYDNARGTLSAIRTARRPHREFLVFRLAG